MNLERASIGGQPEECAHHEPRWFPLLQQNRPNVLLHRGISSTREDQRAALPNDEVREQNYVVRLIDQWLYCSVFMSEFHPTCGSGTARQGARHEQNRNRPLPEATGLGRFTWSLLG